ncbi:MAG: hypothetical protein IJM44_06155 [Ruminococcus sp.]|nr:hypothetical protein [Ruminococcus sp.]
MKKRFISFITSALVAALCINSAAVKNADYGSHDVLTASAEATGINVQYRTQEEISAYISSHPFSCSFEDTYAVQPSVTSPYSAGKLSDTSLTNALNSLNVMRYIAGLDEVTLDSGYCELTQASSLVNCVNGSLSHFPTQPSDMSSDIYDLGYSGSGKSNIAYNAGSFARNTAWSVVYAWMYDEDDYNIDRVGHRRWCLNPTMGKTGFGAVSKNSSYYGSARYSAMYAFDRSNSSADEYGVCWPAQNTPVEFFTQEDPWSISMGTSVDASKVKVTLKRQSDGKSWSFSSSSADGQFYVNNEGYGQSGCIIFLPNDIGKISAGDSFQVDITGLSQNVSYTVGFFQSGFVNTIPGDTPSTTTSTTVTTTAASKQTTTTTTALASSTQSSVTTTQAENENDNTLELEIVSIPADNEDGTFEFDDICVNLWFVSESGYKQQIMDDQPLSELPDSYYYSGSRSRTSSHQTVKITVLSWDMELGEISSNTAVFDAPYPLVETTTTTTTTTSTSTTTTTSSTSTTTTTSTTTSSSAVTSAASSSASSTAVSSTSTVTSTSGQTSSSTTTQPTAPALGDVNADGLIDGADASLILVYNAESADGISILLDAAQLLRADVNRDGLTDGADASMILAFNAYATDHIIDSIIEFLKLNL